MVWRTFFKFLLLETNRATHSFASSSPNQSKILRAVIPSSSSPQHLQNLCVIRQQQQYILSNNNKRTSCSNMIPHLDVSPGIWTRPAPAPTPAFPEHCLRQSHFSSSFPLALLLQTKFSWVELRSTRSTKFQLASNHSMRHSPILASAASTSAA